MTAGLLHSRIHASSLWRGRAPPPLIPDLIRRRALAQTDQPYVTEVDAQGRAVTLSYGQLNACSARLASWLSRRHGIRPGDPVAVAPANSIDSVLALFALVRVGAVTLLINPTDPPQRQMLLRDAVGPVLTLRSARHGPSDVPNSVVIPDIDQLDSGGFSDAQAERWSPLFLVGTSGSTAASKIVSQMHGNAAANAADTVAHHRLAVGDRLLSSMPISHVNGLHFTLMATLAAGAHAILPSGFHPFLYKRLLETYRPHLASVAPSLLEALCLVWRDGRLPTTFRYFVSAAAPLPATTAAVVYERLGARIVQSYGLSETTNFSCAMPHDLDSACYQRLMLDMAIPPVGLPVSNDIAILDPKGTVVADGETGEVCMRGPNVMGGYHGNADATAQAFGHDWFHSGDLGHLHHDPVRGGLIVLTGRSKNIAKIRGETVSLDEMDRQLQAMEGVDDAVSVALPDRLEGELIAVAVVCEPTVSDADLTGHLARMFPIFALPSAYVRLHQMPRTQTGKIRRPDLASLLAERMKAMGA